MLFPPAYSQALAIPDRLRNPSRLVPPRKISPHDLSQFLSFNPSSPHGPEFKTSGALLPECEVPFAYLGQVSKQADLNIAVFRFIAVYLPK